MKIVSLDYWAPWLLNLWGLLQTRVLRVKMQQSEVGQDHERSTIGDIVDDALLNFFGPEGHAELREKRWTFNRIAIPILALVSDVLTVFGAHLAQWGLNIGAALFVLFAALARLQPAYRKRCAVPCAISLIATVAFGGVVVTQKLVGAEDTGFLVKEFPQLRDKLEEISSKLSNLDAKQEKVSSKLDRLEANQADLKYNSEELKKSFLEIQRGGEEAKNAWAQIRNLLRPSQKNIDTYTTEQLTNITGYFLDDVNKAAIVSSNRSDAVKRLLIQSQVRVSALQLDSAAQIVDDGLSQTTASGDRGMLDRAALLAERGRIARLQLNYLEAATYYREASRISTFDKKQSCNYIVESAISIAYLGFFNVEPLILQDAVGKLRSLSSSGIDECEARDLAQAKYILGVALTASAEWTGNYAQIDEAVSAFRAASASSDAPKENRPMLGLALALSGLAKSDKALMDEGVGILRTVISSASAPVNADEFVRLQAGFGMALAMSALQSGNKPDIDEAIDVLRTALKKSSPDGHLHEAVQAKSILGMALAVSGAVNSDQDKLDEAITVSRDVLPSSARDRNPTGWLMAINSLDMALAAEGKKDGDKKKLSEVVGNSRGALNQYSRAIAQALCALQTFAIRKRQVCGRATRDTQQPQVKLSRPPSRISYEGRFRRMGFS